MLDNRDSNRPPLLLPAIPNIHNINNTNNNNNSSTSTTAPTSPNNIPTPTLNNNNNNNNNSNTNNTNNTNNTTNIDNPLDRLARLATNVPKLSVRNDPLYQYHTAPIVANNQLLIKTANNNFNSAINNNPIMVLPTPSTSDSNTNTINTTTTSTSTSTTTSSTPSTSTRRKRKRRDRSESIASITPPPTKPGTPSSTTDLNNLQNGLPPPHLPPKKYSSRYYRKLAEQGNPSKRQRVGPSCDKCRIKKIKCNASIDVVLKDPRVVGMFNEHLHYILTDSDIEMFNTKWSELFGITLPFTICNVPTQPELTTMPAVFKNGTESETSSQTSSSEDPSPSPPSQQTNLQSSSSSGDNVIANFTNTNPDYQVVVKHLDKLIIFQPCTSCNKRKYKNVEQGPTSCKFARGFSRPDINQFNKIKINMMTTNPNITKNMPIYDLTTTDYQNAGYKLIPL